MNYQTALVLGGGAFGTSMGHVLSHNFKRIITLVRSKDLYDCLKQGENAIYLPGKTLPANMVPALNWQEVSKLVDGKIELIVSGLPTPAIRNFCKENHRELVQYFSQEIPLVSLSKGIDPDTLEFPDDIFLDHFGAYRELLYYLSGPTFADEIVDKQITVASLAGKSKRTLEKLALMLQTPYFKVFPTYDIKGVLLGGALKNVVAIAGGIVEGLGYNHNTRAALITRGIVEMLRFGRIYSARPETFYGLSGMGDLILTTTGELSRNKTFGMEIAKGRGPEEIIRSKRTVVEGYKTAKAVYHLANKYDIRCTIFRGVYRVLYEKASPTQVIQEIMSTPPRFEIDDG